MQTTFSPKPGDELQQTLYDSGAVKEERYLRSGIPANGWSRKEYYEDGSLRFAECYSHQVVIEQIFYDEAGVVVTHKIYNLVQKKLIDKPTVTAVIRPNIVVGYGHMGFYFELLPEISRFIGAAYDPGSLEKAYEDYRKAINADEDLETDDGQFNWSIRGDRMIFKLWFEKHEMLYQWILFTRSEEEYARARVFMEDLTEKYHER